MDENEIREDSNRASSGNIEEILRERERLTELLQKKFKKRVVILFTDICGYTNYVETRGDISGRAIIQKHNDIVMPLIEKYEGMVIKTIGDAVMATFTTPLAAVKAAVAIQNGLWEHNKKVEDSDRIHVRIGINMGDALVDKTDVFGDAVNIASRIQSQAEKDQILISRVLYEHVSGSEDILCRWHGTVQVKGKTQLLELYKVVWQDQDITQDVTPTVRAQDYGPEKKPAKPSKVLQLEATREDKNLAPLRSAIGIMGYGKMGQTEVFSAFYSNIPLFHVACIGGGTIIS